MDSQTSSNLFGRFAPSPSPPAETPAPSSRFGTLQPGDIPATPSGGLKLSADIAKRDAIREAFEWSWSAYEKHAFGADEVGELGVTSGRKELNGIVSSVIAIWL